MNIGFVGLGNMGGFMALRLLNAGFSVKVFDIDKQQVAKLTSEGASSIDNIGDLFSYSDLVLLSLPGPPQVKAVINEALKCSAIKAKGVIDLSTVDPETTEWANNLLQSRGCAFVDAPVSGGTIGAKNGTLTIMIGGPKDYVDEVWPILSVLGKELRYIGDSGSGIKMKLIVQYMVTANLVAACEAIAMAKKVELPLETVIDVLQKSTGTSIMFERKAPTIANDDYTTKFALKLAYKDVKLVHKMADDFGIVLSLGVAAKELLKSGMAKELGNLDFSAVFKVIEENNGL